LKIESPRKKKNPKKTHDSAGEVSATTTLIAHVDEPEDTESGIQIAVNLPRKKLIPSRCFSGGERSLVGIAALFAMISVSPLLSWCSMRLMRRLMNAMRVVLQKC